MLNEYRIQFYAVCPVNGKEIRYRLKIKSEDNLKVEDIKAQTEFVSRAMHEDIADMMFNAFGGRQVLKAWHHGVHIKTVRG